MPGQIDLAPADPDHRFRFGPCRGTGLDAVAFPQVFDRDLTRVGQNMSAPREADDLNRGVAGDRVNAYVEMTHVVRRDVPGEVHVRQRAEIGARAVSARP